MSIRSIQATRSLSAVVPAKAATNEHRPVFLGPGSRASRSAGTTS